MGGIADYTGSLVCQLTLDRALALALQQRPDRELQIFSFNLFDEHLPFTFRISLDALANATIDSLRRDFSEPGRKWAAYIAGCLFILHHHNLLDLKNPHIPGLNLALYSTIPMAAGLASSAALEIATMLNLLAHFQITLEPLRIAALCQQVETQIAGAPCGIMDQVASLLGHQNQLLRLLCQPAQLQPPLPLPNGIRFVGIDSGIRHSLATPSQYSLTRCAASIGHKIILHQMHQIAAHTQTTLTSDPMNGYLANLDPDDYKSLFRPHLPEKIVGRDFLHQFGPTLDPLSPINPDQLYHPLGATDHHILESRRVKQFCSFLEQARELDPPQMSGMMSGMGSGTPMPVSPPQSQIANRKSQIQSLLHKSGHLMYASHHSYTHDALLGHPHCDLLVQLIRANEHHGLYGARITAAGQGGTLAVLSDTSDSATNALHQILQTYKEQTGLTPTLLTSSSPGALHFGTHLVPP
jgi:L-arabinokinase